MHSTKARALLFRMGIDGESHQIGYQKAVKPQKHLSPSKDKAQLRKKADSTQEGSR
jgi:hypothetical protein